MDGCGLREASVAALTSCASSPQHPPPLHILQGSLILQHHPASSGKAQSAAPASYLCHPGRCLELWLWGHTAAAAVSWSGTAGVHTHQDEEDSGLTSVLGHGVRASLLPHTQLPQAEGPPTLAGLLQYILLLLLMSDATRQAPLKSGQTACL